MSIFAQAEAVAIARAYLRRVALALGVLAVLAALGLVGIGASYYSCQMQDSEVSP